MFNLKLFLLLILFFVIGFLLILEIQKTPLKSFNGSSNVHQWIIALATLGILILGVLSYGIQRQMVNVSEKMSEIAEISANQDKIKLQAELRPYLIIQLYPEPNIFGTKEYLKKDGNSNYFWDGLHSEKFLVLPFKLKNVGKIPAVNIKAKYDSPSQSDVWFKIGENSISPDTTTSEIFRPWINISSIINNPEKEFSVTLTVTYKGNDEIDSRTYFSLLTLQITKQDSNIYLINSSNFEFGAGEIDNGSKG